MKGGIFMENSMLDEQYAKSQFKNLERIIKGFESKLDDKHEVAVALVSFGESVLMHVVKIDYLKPSTFAFCGYVNGKKSILIQDSYQLNVLVSAVETEHEMPNRVDIGYDVSSDSIY